MQVDAGEFERGLLGLAFHPAYAQNGRFFVHYTNLDGDVVIAEYAAAPDADTVDPAVERILLRIPHPEPIHNGGQLQFGPDGYLYVGIGDGGAGRQRDNGQRKDVLLGKILRLDVDRAIPYAIPPDNPFVGDPGARPEIWALGLRNPWRFSFDRATGDLFIADVGQSTWEEVNLQPAGRAGGENYGWAAMEGPTCLVSAEECATGAFTGPVATYGHNPDGGCAIVGGYVYRGRRFESLVGTYFFGDFCTGRIWGMRRGARGEWSWSELKISDLRISSFGEAEDGELFVLDHQGGGVYRLTRPLFSLVINQGFKRSTMLVTLAATYFAFQILTVASGKLLAGPSPDQRPDLRSVAGIPDLAFAAGAAAGALAATMVSGTLGLNLQTLLALALMLLVLAVGSHGFVWNTLKWKTLVLPILMAVPLVAIGVGQPQISVPAIGRLDFGPAFSWVVVPVAMLGATYASVSLRTVLRVDSLLAVVALAWMLVIARAVGNVALLLLLLAGIGAFAGGIFHPRASRFHPSSGTMLAGALIATAGILADAEIPALIVMGPYLCELVFRALSGFRDDAFIASRQGRLYLSGPRPRALSHFIVQRWGGLKETTFGVGAVVFGSAWGALALMAYYWFRR